MSVTPFTCRSRCMMALSWLLELTSTLKRSVAVALRLLRDEEPSMKIPRSVIAWVTSASSPWRSRAVTRISIGFGGSDEGFINLFYDRLDVVDSAV